ncbi:hypothetical protein ANCDUO_19066 [Ancylostoma duodenale]|uniref:Amidinotransferase n=1 Tax=Ancylostoma duodenale TaxID=51022 RepID=A0A0C2CMD0_9BILA|nr:hypothetical protein ANCDUO_19066 [Ancylostoma duodenale]
MDDDQDDSSSAIPSHVLRTFRNSRTSNFRFYHLDTAICPLDDNTAIYFPKAFDEDGQNELKKHLELIPVEESEAEKFACNSVVIGKNVIMNQGSVKIAKVLVERGYKVHFVAMSEYLKSGGSAKCLTLRLDFDWYKK